jgi:hypothetical protein
VAGADHAGEGLGEHAPVVDAGRPAAAARQHAQIERAVGQRAGRVGRDLVDPQLDAGGDPAERGQEPGQQDQLGVVAGGDVEGAARGRRIERGLVGQRARGELERLPHPRRQRHGARGGDQAARTADQQRIAEQLAQAGESVADRGLAEAEPARRPGDVALVDERVEHRQQVEVDLAQPIMHVAHDEDTRHRLDGWRGRAQVDAINRHRWSHP